MWKRSVLVAAAVGALAGCEEDRAGPPAEVVRMQREAARDACISTELLARASEQLSTLVQLHGVDDPTILSAEDFPAGPMRATFEYARVLQHHADLRHGFFAHLDSAFNHVRSPADSLRHTQAAANLRTPTPEPGTVEANVAEAYARDLAALREDADHRCNWAL